MFSGVLHRVKGISIEHENFNKDHQFNGLLLSKCFMDDIEMWENQWYIFFPFRMFHDLLKARMSIKVHQIYFQAYYNWILIKVNENKI